jgi:DNA-binding MurR/RpiR family transcriptional regulator
LVVVIAWAHESAEAAQALRMAAQQGARTLALTSSPISLCAQSAEIALVCPLPDALPMPSVTLMALLLDILMQMLARQANVTPRERLGRATLSG